MQPPAKRLPPQLRILGQPYLQVGCSAVTSSMLGRRSGRFASWALASARGTCAVARARAVLAARGRQERRPRERATRSSFADRSHGPELGLHGASLAAGSIVASGLPRLDRRAPAPGPRVVQRVLAWIDKLDPVGDLLATPGALLPLLRFIWIWTEDPRGFRPEGFVEDWLASKKLWRRLTSDPIRTGSRSAYAVSGSGEQRRDIDLPCGSLPGPTAWRPRPGTPPGSSGARPRASEDRRTARRGRRRRRRHVMSDNYFCRSTTTRFAGSSTSG